MAFSDAAWERAMEVREVIFKAVSGEIHWFRAGETLGISGRTLRRWRERHERFGFKGLMDKRRRVPSARRVPLGDVETILRLYREGYRGWNVRHFHEELQREHRVKHSYSFVKHVLQEAGLVRRKQARGRHRLRREPRPCFGEMVLIDGSRHGWLERKPRAEAGAGLSSRRCDIEPFARPAPLEKATHHNAPGSTQASRVDLRVVPAISTYGLSGSTGRARVPASGRLRLPPAGTGARLPASSSESGQITCQNRADTSLVNNIESAPVPASATAELPKRLAQGRLREKARGVERRQRRLARTDEQRDLRAGQGHGVAAAVASRAIAWL